MVTDAPITISDYDDLIGLLSPRFRVIVLEAPACGFSIPKLNFDFSYEGWTQAFIDTLDALELGPVHLVMPCVSGLSGVGIANKRPDLVRSLIVSQTADWSPERKWAHSLGRLGMFRVPIWGQLLMLKFKQSRWDERLPLIVGQGADRLLPNLTASLSHGACYCMASAGMYFLTHTCPSDVRPVRQPSLAIWGLKDRGHVAAKTDMNSVSALLPSAEVKLLEDVGHWPEVENPSQFAQILTDFIDRTDDHRQNTSKAVYP
jgi:pimeloyl-ACP methyl ester carboxylesterase